MNIERGGVQSAGGERSANFARRTLAEKGGVILQPLRASLLHFLVNFFRLVDRHFSLVARHGALSWVGEFNVV